MKKKVKVLLIYIIVFGSTACGLRNQTSASPDMLVTSTPSVSESNLFHEEKDRKLSGNSSGNLLLGGKLAQEGEWVFYSNQKDKGYIYRKKIDGSITEKINDVESAFLNVCDGWIYYLQVEEGKDTIFRMKADGSNQEEFIFKLKINGDFKEKTYDGSIDEVIYWDGFLYFTIDGGHLCRIRKDGTGIEIIWDGVYRSDGTAKFQTNITVWNDWIYYIDSETEYIYRIKTDGSCNELLFDRKADNLVIDDNWMFFQTSNYDNEFCKMKTDGSEFQLISNDILGSINIVKDRIYYIEEENAIWSMKKDGTDKTLIVESGILYEFYITENALLYNYLEGEKYNWKDKQVLQLLD